MGSGLETQIEHSAIEPDGPVPDQLPATVLTRQSPSALDTSVLTAGARNSEDSSKDDHAQAKHAALLGDPRLNQRGSQVQRALLVQQLQQDFGNRHVAQVIARMPQPGSLEQANGGFGASSPLVVQRAGPSYPKLNLPIKLRDHENCAGPGQGHTIAKHVAKSDTFLRNRLKTEPNIPAATSFISESAAESLINDALAANKANVENWLQSGGVPVFPLSFSGSSVGYGFKRPTAHPHDPAEIDKQPKEGFSSVRVVLRKGGPNGWYIVTAHPDV
jgi:hypothetical protein